MKQINMQKQFEDRKVWFFGKQYSWHWDAVNSRWSLKRVIEGEVITDDDD